MSHKNNKVTYIYTQASVPSSQGPKLQRLFERYSGGNDNSITTENNDTSYATSTYDSSHNTDDTAGQKDDYNIRWQWQLMSNGPVTDCSQTMTAQRKIKTTSQTWNSKPIV